MGKMGHGQSFLNHAVYFNFQDAFIFILDKIPHSKDLFDYITEKGRLDEQLAQNFLHQVGHQIL